MVVLGSIRKGTSVNIASTLQVISVDFSNSIIRKVGNGCSIRFWEDVWCDHDRATDELGELMQNLSTLSLKVEIADGWTYGFSANRIITVANNKLPTFSALATRGISPVTSLCPLCEQVLESTDHIFCECVIVKRILDKCGR
ncbi:RNA-directed DNA polymerase, eukaryota [Tanacetum coccineum]